MKNQMILRAKHALQGEQGGPQVETIVGISVALIVATALIALGIAMNTWIGSAQGELDGLSVGKGINWE